MLRDSTLYKRFEFCAAEGFTLVEILVVITIFAAVGIVITNLFIGHNNLYYFSSAEVNGDSQARLAMDRMVGMTREAESIVASRLFSGTVFSSGASTLVERLKTVNSSNDFVTGSYDYVVYYLDSLDPSKLMETVEAGPQSRRVSSTRLLANNVQNLNFVYTPSDLSSAKTITIGLLIRSQLRNSTSTVDLSSSVKIRGKS